MTVRFERKCYGIPYLKYQHVLTIFTSISIILTSIKIAGYTTGGMSGLYLISLTYRKRSRANFAVMLFLSVCSLFQSS
ncbi:hypothetical protein LMH87_000358 [Akanthomyces muscarius]|uniref:Uncharacterized protein n=1 Tax=Akanthomyces muscarius TaxID=2231603 RepID=A0A9W8QH67_AKAMU|nr:hypothetical protein LMH87_000358 [Akanthomyces muscarius]KAJ4155093.1 hypothetical protein LMH87_000358 [Akanthomyces muscarius]